MQIDTISSEQSFREKIMLQPDDVNQILTLRSCGWGSKRIAKQLGISRGTVKKYLRQGAWLPAPGRKSKKLKGLEEWLRKSFDQHQGNCDVVRQELKREHQIDVSLRTVERAVKEWRMEKEA